MQIADKKPISLMEVPIVDGKPVMPSREELENASRDGAKTMRDLWAQNISINQDYVIANRIPSTKSEYATRKPWRDILAPLVPELYYVAREAAYEVKRRRINATRNKVILCGTGNSLLRSSLYLHEAIKKGWHVMAVDRARPQLLSWGIRPVCTVTLDAQEHVINYFDGLTKDETVFASFQTHPDLLKLVQESPAKLRVNTTWDEEGLNQHIKDKVGKDYLCVMAHCIVMPTALNIAIMLGYKTVATIGNELGWDSAAAVEDIYKGSTKEDENGWHSIKAFRDAADGFRDIARALKASNAFYCKEKEYVERRLIDCSGGIDKGYPYMHISQMLSEVK